MLSVTMMMMLSTAANLHIVTYISLYIRVSTITLHTLMLRMMPWCCFANYFECMNFNITIYCVNALHGN